MFPTGKNRISLGIPCILQNFWHKKGPEYFNQLPFNVLSKQKICEMKAL